MPDRVGARASTDSATARVALEVAQLPPRAERGEHHLVAVEPDPHAAHLRRAVGVHRDDVGQVRAFEDLTGGVGEGDHRGQGRTARCRLPPYVLDARTPELRGRAWPASARSSTCRATHPGGGRRGRARPRHGCSAGLEARSGGTGSTRATGTSSRSTRRGAATSTRRCTSSVARAAASGCATPSPTWRRSSPRRSALDAEVWDARRHLLPARRAGAAAPAGARRGRGQPAAGARTVPPLLWTIDLDSDGVAGDARLGASPRAQPGASSPTTGVQAALDAGGRRTRWRSSSPRSDAPRQAIEADRGGVSLDLPTQRVDRRRRAATASSCEQTVPAMGWNAQISLLAGMVGRRRDARGRRRAAADAAARRRAT